MESNLTWAYFSDGLVQPNHHLLHVPVANIHMFCKHEVVGHEITQFLGMKVGYKGVRSGGWLDVWGK